MITDDLVEFARRRTAEETVSKGRCPLAVYRRFFPAAEVFRAAGWSIPRMVEAFVSGGHWPQEKADALRQALGRHFRREADA